MKGGAIDRTKGIHVQDGLPRTQATDVHRRKLLGFVFIAAGASALGVATRDSLADTEDFPVPRRVPTGRDDYGKSVFKSFDVTSHKVPGSGGATEAAAPARPYYYSPSPTANRFDFSRTLVR